MKKIIILIILCLSTFSCSSFPWKSEKESENQVVKAKKKRINPNVLEKAMENEQGIIFGGKKKGGTTFEFASSNVLWQASLETLDFIPLSNLTYTGGVIVTDWYSGQNGSSNEQVKINIRFLSEELKPSSFIVKSYKKTCKTALDCKVELMPSNFNLKIKDQILEKAIALNIAENNKKK
jgi:hypothetical protein